MEDDKPLEVQPVRIVSDWTPPLVKEILEVRLKALEDRVTDNIEHAKADAAQLRREVDGSAAAIKLRFDGFNEFNRRMETITADTMPRSEIEGRLKALADRITTRADSSSDNNRLLIISIVGWVIAAAAVVAAFYTKH